MWQDQTLPKECHGAKWKSNKKSANMIEVDGENLEYDNLLPIVFLFVIHPIRGLRQEPIFTCVSMFIWADTEHF